MVGSVEIADQYSGERIAQRLVHDCFAPTPPQEVAFGGGAESPDVAVGPALTPAGFVGVDHRAGADAVQDRGHCRLGPLRRAMDGAHDGPHAEAQLMHGVQIPLDTADGPPPLFPQRGDQAEQVDAEALLAQDHAVQFRRRCAAPSARRSSPSNVDVLGDLHRNHRQLDDFPSALDPAAGPVGAAIGTVLHHVLHPVVGVRRGRAKPWGRCLRGPCCAGGFRPGFAWPSSSAIRRCNRSITACNSALMAIRTARSAVVRSTSVSMPCI